METSVPGWWLTVSGLYFVLSSLFMLGMIIAMIFLVRALSGLSARVQTLSQKAEGVVDSIRKTTDHVGPRVVSISKTAEQVASNVGKRFEILATVGLAIFALQRLRKSNLSDD
ncbi:MAG TPA: hypothetical protein PLO61_05435 [Fimbriimonadaceae bacterium]|nr:hypothetical protein [Fimbriimonadaceae bacterium]HRJ33046.1 hypothetical protein [Fimbriimonadaceae bacterium]